MIFKLVEIIIYFNNRGTNEYLLLKRVPQKGGFWQPITGGVFKGESLMHAGLREVNEETGITDENIISFRDLKFSFEFTDNGKDYIEYVFFAEVSDKEVVLSNEHEEYLWLGYNQAISILKWESNIEAFRKVHELLNPKS